MIPSQTQMHWILWSSVNSLGTKFSETWCICKFSVKIAWHEPIDIPNFYVTSHTASWRSAFIMSFTWVIKESLLATEGPSTSQYHLLSSSASDKFVPLSGDHFSQSLIVARFACHSMVFCSHFTEFATQFCASYFVALRAAYHNATKLTMRVIITPKHII
jgi:hypothetical protein